MSTATTAKNGAAKGSQAEQSAKIGELLTQAMNQAPVTVRTRGMQNSLMANIEQIRQSLPKNYQGDAERLIRRAIIYFQTTPRLDPCTPQSLIMAFIKATECGLPLDGKLGHAVPFNNKYKDENGKDYWLTEATFMPDYKGLVAVAKRTGLIDDIYAEVVCKGDYFKWLRTHDKDTFEHTYDLESSAPRDKTIGVYCKVKPHNAEWRYELMTRADVDSIRDKSKAKDNGPWQKIDSSDWREMAKKTVMKRVLKLWQDDPGLAALMDADDQEYIETTATNIPIGQPQKPGRIADMVSAATAGFGDESTDGHRQRSEEADDRQSSDPRQSQLNTCRQWLEIQPDVKVSMSDPETGTIEYKLPNDAAFSIGDKITLDGSVDTLDADSLQQVKNIVEASRRKPR